MASISMLAQASLIIVFAGYALLAGAVSIMGAAAIGANAVLTGLLEMALFLRSGKYAHGAWLLAHGAWRLAVSGAVS
jgi:hypothetical protein